MPKSRRNLKTIVLNIWITSVGGIEDKDLENNGKDMRIREGLRVKGRIPPMHYKPRKIKGAKIHEFGKDHK